MTVGVYFMKVAKCLALIFIFLSSCRSTKSKYLRAYIDIDKRARSIEKRLSTSDTAIFYLKLCSGCIPGTERKLYALIKAGNSTKIKPYSNYGVAKPTEINLPWKYILSNYKSVATEQPNQPTTTRIVDGKEVTISTSIDHGHYYRLIMHIGGDVSENFLAPGERNNGYRPLLDKLLDTLDRSLDSFQAPLIHYKLQPKGYKP